VVKPATKPPRLETAGYKKPPANDKPIQEKVANQRDNKVNIAWQWPVTGSVIRRFSVSGAVVNKGLDIAGRQGDPVLAAASGKVVYSGPGMIGYGNLIIIKHDDTVLSAYAHNSKLLVSEGETVKAGQRIAEIGSSGTTRHQLHFEIRRNGKPVDPLLYLPKR
jgi:lipoprotein NlpD